MHKLKTFPVVFIFSVFALFGTYHSSAQGDIQSAWTRQLYLAASDSNLFRLSPKEAANQLDQLSGTPVTIKNLVPRDELLSESSLLFRIAQSTVVVNMTYNKRDSGKIIPQINPATGYIIDSSGICVTNYHVIRQFADKSFYTSLSVMTIEGKSYPVIRILAASETDDLAILQVDTFKDRLIPLSLGEAAEQGEKIYIMSHPNSQFYTPATGEILEYKNSLLSGRPCEIMHISADFFIGSSGAAVTDKFGNVVGTVSRISNNEKWAIPVKKLKLLLKDII